MKIILVTILFILGGSGVSALTVSEVMSNPTGEDSGREWVEIYNESSTDLDISSMMVSIKGGATVVTTPLQGGTSLPVGGYAIIGSVVSGQTKFLQDYPNYSGTLFKSSISLVNTGTTSIDIKVNGSVVASLSSYTAAKEGHTLSYVGGSYVTGTPTPGADNQVADTSTNTTPTATTTETQVTLPQKSPPTADIMIYLPTEKVVVAGAEADFSVFSQTRAGKSINDLRYTWAFGDGGQSIGSSTKYRYAYSGRYIAQVEATNADVVGLGRMVVKVVQPDIAIKATGQGRYGAYIEIDNPNEYDLDLSQWTLTIDGAGYPFPKNTLLSAGASTRFSGLAMGFASSTLATSTVIKIRFPNLEDVAQYVPQGEPVLMATSAPVTPAPVPAPVRFATRPVQKAVLGVSTSTQMQATSSVQGKSRTKDTRLVSWFRTLFSWK